MGYHGILNIFIFEQKDIFIASTTFSIKNKM